MSDDDKAPHQPGQESGQVLRFRQRTSENPPSGAAAEKPALDLRKFEGSGEPDDYKHRMIVNVVALLFIAALVGGGLWIATTMAQMRKNQDCVLSGRRGCSPVEFSRDRW
ncbi:MAG: hypothetical protein JOZ70_01095 [Pseudolabrys sp.]|nr:hypothetical protein [Pseudolabrys sp.]MBV9953820.1 hypothetical protein [Pseudolabrys sp.]